MGAMKSQFRQAGGRLNGVDGIITSHEWTDVFPFGEGQPSKSGFRSLYCVLSVRQDGADEDILEPLWAGDADAFTISDDGQALTPLTGGYQIGENTDLAKFVRSLEACPNFPGAQSDAPGVISFSPMNGARVHFVQVQQLDKNGKPLTRKAKTGKYAGREFPQTSTEVRKFYGMVGVIGAEGTIASARPTTTNKSNGKVVSIASEDVVSLTNQTLYAILGDSPPSGILKSKLRTQLITKLGANPLRSAVIELAHDNTYLAGLEGVRWNAATGTIALA